jgi:hypothetical protein
MQDESQIRHQIDTDPDYIALKRYDFSLEKFLERYPNGVSDDEAGVRVIARALQMTEDEVRKTSDRIVGALQRAMKVRT